MILASFLDALRKIYLRLQDSSVVWVVTGSLGLALQGVPVEVHDIDLQTDGAGAYEIEHRLAEYVTQPVQHRVSERIRSHFGALEIDGVQVEIMGAFQKRLDDGDWEAPVDVAQHRRWVKLDDMQIPVLALEYELQAYRLLGRSDKAEVIHQWLQKRSDLPGI